MDTVWYIARTVGLVVGALQVAQGTRNEPQSGGTRARNTDHESGMVESSKFSNLFGGKDGKKWEMPAMGLVDIGCYRREKSKPSRAL